jgi:DNA replication protein DnaC
MRSSLQEYLKQLRLSGLAQSLEVRLSEASGNRLDHAEFLELILQDELAVRGSRQIERRVRAASFRETRNLDEFDFSFNTSIKRRQIEELATCRFIREKSDVLLLGPPGVGKSFLAQAIGHQAIKAGMLVLYRSIFDLARDFLSEEETPAQQDKILSKYLKPELLVIDDMGMKQLPRRSGEYLLEIIMRRHENRSTMMTSNRPLEDWAKLIGDVPAATAILDRFLQHATIIQITGKSYRLRNGKEDTTAKSKGAGKKDSEGRPSAGGEGVSPPEDTETPLPLSSHVEGKTGIKT